MADATNSPWQEAPRAAPFGEIGDKEILSEPSKLTSELRKAHADFNNWYMDIYQLQLGAVDEVSFNIDPLISQISSTKKDLLNLLLTAKIVYQDQASSSWRFNPQYFELIKYIEYQYDLARQTSTRELSTDQATNIANAITIAGKIMKLN